MITPVSGCRDWSLVLAACSDVQSVVDLVHDEEEVLRRGEERLRDEKRKTHGQYTRKVSDLENMVSMRCRDFDALVQQAKERMNELAEEEGSR